MCLGLSLLGEKLLFIIISYLYDYILQRGNEYLLKMKIK